MPRRPPAALLLSALTLLAAALSPPATRGDDAAAEAASESWQVMSMGGSRIGYAHFTVREEGAGERGTGEGGTGEQRTGEDRVLVTDSDVKMTFSRFGMRIRMGIRQTTRETADGELLAVDLKMSNPPSAPTALHAERAGDVLVTRWTMGGAVTRGEVPLGEDVKSPAYQDRYLKEHPLAPGESASFKMFVAELGQVATVTITAGGEETVRVFDGSERELETFTVTQDLVRIPTTVYQDEDGRALVTKSSVFGQDLLTYDVSAEEALREVAAGNLDLGFDSLIDAARPDGTPVPDPHRTGRSLTYRVTLPDGDPSKLFPPGETQSVERVSDHVAEVTVKGSPVPHGPAGGAADYTGPTRYLQCEDAGVVRHADAAAGTVPADADAGTLAAAMERYVSRAMTDKNFSVAMAGAAEVAETLSGDCTEHSVLLAAMLRNRGIPSRVAVGFVMIPGRGQMGGHMWTEAYLTTPDGPAWVPLDATLGRGGIGGGHLKLGDSSLADEAAAPITSFLPMLELLGKVRVEVVAVDGERAEK